MEGVLLLLPGQGDHDVRGRGVEDRAADVHQAAAGGDLRHALHAPLARLQVHRGHPVFFVDRELDYHRHAAGEDRRATDSSDSEVVRL